ncbi:MAG: DUF4863 family protein [Paracoccaceae bacterium]
MAKTEFLEILQEVSDSIEGQPLDNDLEQFLNENFPPDDAKFARLSRLCDEGEADGWLVEREAGGIKFGRAVKPGNEAGRFSVDVVRMKDVVGPHHIHTTGEIGAIMPISGNPRFDGKPKGWYVYPPGSDHNPTVTGGDAYVLYMLPEGMIEFTGK